MAALQAQDVERRVGHAEAISAVDLGVKVLEAKKYIIKKHFRQESKRLKACCI